MDPTARQNTLVVDFNALSVRPSTGDIEKFIRVNLGIEMNTIKNLQLHSIPNCGLIELRSLQVAEQLAAMHNLKHYLIAGNKKYNIPVYVEDTATNVRIHDLPPCIPNETVADFMKQYGTVKSVARELWKKFFTGIPNGVRVVRIDLDKHIPSFITIKDKVTAVSYHSQIPTCRQCKKKAHPKRKCSEVATIKTTMQRQL